MLRWLPRGYGCDRRPDARVALVACVAPGGFVDGVPLVAPVDPVVVDAATTALLRPHFVLHAQNAPTRCRRPSKARFSPRVYVCFLQVCAAIASL